MLKLTESAEVPRIEGFQVEIPSAKLKDILLGQATHYKGTVTRLQGYLDSMIKQNRLDYLMVSIVTYRVRIDQLKRKVEAFELCAEHLMKGKVYCLTLQDLRELEIFPSKDATLDDAEADPRHAAGPAPS